MRFLLLSLLLLSAASFGGTKVTPNVGSNMSILNSNNTGYLSGNNYWKQGDNVTSYMERLGRHTPIGVTPSRSVPVSRIASAAKDLIRFSPSAIASSVGLMAIVEGAGWAIDELTGQITKQQEGAITDPSVSIWTYGSYSGPTPEAACKASQTAIYGPGTVFHSTQFNSKSGNKIDWLCAVTTPFGSISNSHNVTKTGPCPTGTTYVPSSGVCSSGVITVPVSPSDIDGLPVSGDAPFYDGLMRDACNLSSSPARCFDSLTDKHKLEGPSTVSGPKTTTTSTQTNADGSTTTVEKETQTEFDVAYGDDHFVYTPKTTTKTKVDGQPTETTTEQEDPGTDSEQKPQEEAPVSKIAGLKCEAAIACSGDAIQCAIASTQKDTKCILQDAYHFDDATKNSITAEFQGEAFVMDEEEIDIPSFIGQGARFLPSSCPAPIPLALSGKTFQLDTQPFCTFANDLSYLIVAFATLAAALYIGRAFGGE